MGELIPAPSESSTYFNVYGNELFASLRKTEQEVRIGKCGEEPANLDIIFIPYANATLSAARRTRFAAPISSLPISPSTRPSPSP